MTDPLADRTTIICNAAYERYIRTKAVPPNKLQMIPNGVDTDTFAPCDEIRERLRKDLNLGDSFVWLAVGRLVEQKDYPNLFSALARVPEGNWRVLIAGQGPLETDLKTLVDELALTDRVQFIGTRSNMADLFKASDAYVMSSAFEGLSIALLEAAATGVPAVVTDVGGNRELVLDGQTGYVVPRANPQALASAITRLMELPDSERRDFGSFARTHCIEHYRFQTVADTWVRLYRRLMSGNARRASAPVAREECALTED
jgi:glycosyltransferase involved in cell wall biosynthesis